MLNRYERLLPSLVYSRGRLAVEQLALDKVLEDELGRLEVVGHAAGLHEAAHQGQGRQHLGEQGCQVVDLR